MPQLAPSNSQAGLQARRATRRRRQRWASSNGKRTLTDSTRPQRSNARRSCSSSCSALLLTHTLQLRSSIVVADGRAAPLAVVACMDDDGRDGGGVVGMGKAGRTDRACAQCSGGRGARAARCSTRVCARAANPGTAGLVLHRHHHQLSKQRLPAPRLTRVSVERDCPGCDGARAHPLHRDDAPTGSTARRTRALPQSL